MCIVEFEFGDVCGVGVLYWYIWKGVLLYWLIFDMCVWCVEWLYVFEGCVSGVIEGDGCWLFVVDGVCIVVCYDWYICMYVCWMNWLELFVWLLFWWNYDVVMCEGVKGFVWWFGVVVEMDGWIFWLLLGVDCVDV